MNWKKLTISDKKRFDRYFNENRINISELTFTNLYIRSFSRKIEFAEIEDYLCIKITYPDKTPFLLPPVGKNKSALKNVFEKLITDFRKNNYDFIMKSIDEENKEIIRSTAVPGLSFEEDRDNFDYIYSVEELIKLEGNKYHKKKNHLNKFIKKYDFEYKTLKEECYTLAVEAQEEWCIFHDCDKNKALAMEAEGIINALKNHNKLDCKCGMVLVDNRVIAFSIGAALNSDTVSIHIEKAMRDYQGSYQIINKLFLENEWPDFKYVNREDDIGIPGLRKAKLSYHPIKFIKKYKADIKS